MSPARRNAGGEPPPAHLITDSPHGTHLAPEMQRSEAARRYYASALGFAVTDAARLIFTAEDLWKRLPGFSGTICIGVTDVDGFYAEVAGKADVAWPLQTMSYGMREFGIKDCNGYTLAFQAQA